MAFGAAMTLSNGGILRGWSLSDAASVLALYQDPDVVRWDPFLPMLDVADAEAWLARRVDGADEAVASWAITGVDGSVVGSVSVSHLDLASAPFPPVSATISYHLLPAARGQGFASQAVAQVCAWVQQARGLHRVELHHDIANAASCAVATRVGFDLEGTRRRAQPSRDGWRDEHLHAWLAADGDPTR